MCSLRSLHIEKPNMPSPTPKSDNIFLLPSSHTADVTDKDIATFSLFVVKSGEHLCARLNRDTLTNCPPYGSKKSRCVFDALAAVCVSDSSQCLALSVSFGKKVRICIAQNDTKPSPSIRQHLTSIWKQLQVVAELEKALIEKKKSRNTKRFEEPGPAKDISAESLRTLVENLHCIIHKYCYLKTKERVKQYLAGFEDFYEYYLMERGSLDSDDTLSFSLRFLRTILQIVDIEPWDGSGISMSDCLDLARMLICLSHGFSSERLNRIRAVTAAWENVPEAKKSFLHRFNLERALRKLTTLTHEIQQLIDFACSRQFRSAFGKELEIVLVDPIASSLPEPSVQEMKNVVEKAVNAATPTNSKQMLEDDPVAREEFEIVLDEELKRVEEPLFQVSTVSVHAEHTLLVHHHREAIRTPNPQFVPPFQHIAVTKKPCSCCQSLYRAYSETTGRTFCLRGSHSILYPLKFSPPMWAPTDSFAGYPGDLPAELRRHLYSTLVRFYSLNIKAAEKYYVRYG